MNALANDQMKRLRQILQAAPHITFGRYVGDTKESDRDAAETFGKLNPGEPMLPNELLSRRAMRATPPHLLLTNYAMLEYLLLRPADMDLFEGDYAGSWQFLVLDEAHVYDGARAAEVAMLLRRLRDRVARDWPLRYIATSATVGDNAEEVTEFARRFFDAPFEWVPDDPGRQDLVRASRVDLPKSPFWGPLDPAGYIKIAEADDPVSELLRRAPVEGAINAPGVAGAILAQESRMARLRELLAAGPQMAERTRRQAVRTGRQASGPAPLPRRTRHRGQPDHRAGRPASAVRPLPPLRPRHRRRLHLPVGDWAARHARPPRAMP